MTRQRKNVLFTQQQKCNDPRLQAGNAKATNTFESRVAWFEQKPKPFCGIS